MVIRSEQTISNRKNDKRQRQRKPDKMEITENRTSNLLFLFLICMRFLTII